ncbi:MAG: glycosyltransferase family 4 protein [Coriobacteriia bacterium]|nr:glycosyltransferase family 4 protein [Coriobacteriia bacterium]
MRPVAISGPLPGADAGSVGGVAVHTERLADGLARTGREVLVLDDSHPADRPQTGAVGVRGAGARHIGALALRHPAHSAATAARALYGHRQAASFVPAATAITRSLLIAEALRTTPAAVLHIQQADYRPLYADWAGARLSRVIAVHGLGMLHATARPGLEALVRSNLAGAAAVVTPSEWLADEVRSLGLPARNIHVIPNGVDHALFRPRDRSACKTELSLDPDMPLVVYVGRLTVAKGVGDLLEAWNRVLAVFPAARLALVGPASDSLPGLPSAHVLTPGAVDMKDAARWLSAADVVAVPSHYEGFGLSALEAMASARPVVATRVGGLSEIVTADAGALVEPRDPGALATALLGMLDDPDAATAAGMAGARVAANYSWEATALAFGKLYDEL